MKAIESERWSGLEELRAPLAGCLVRHGADPHEIDDVIQETFLRAARYRADARRIARLRSWAMRIAVNVLADRRNAGRRHATSIEDEHADVPEPLAPEPDEPPRVRIGRRDLDRDDAVRLLQGELSELREEDRTLLRSYYGGAGSCRETADECDVPPHLVKVRLFRARQRLCRAMRQRLALSRPGLAGLEGPARPSFVPESRHETR